MASKYYLEAIEQAQRTIGQQKGPAGAAGDALDAPVDGSAFGTLPSSSALSSAVTSFRSAASTESNKAGEVLGAIERGLDAVHTTVVNLENEGKLKFRDK